MRVNALRLFLCSSFIVFLGIATRFRVGSLSIQNHYHGFLSLSSADVGDFSRNRLNPTQSTNPQEIPAPRPRPRETGKIHKKGVFPLAAVCVSCQ